MQRFTIQQSSRRRRHQACAALIGVGLLTGVGGCGSGDDSPQAGAAPPATAQPSLSETGVETAAESGAPTEVDGRYTVTWTAEELTEQLSEVLGGADDPQAQQEAEDLGNGNAGTIELILDGGRYDLVYVDFNDSCPGTYVLDGDRIVMTATTDPSDWDCGDGLGETAVDAAWSLDGSTLTLSDWEVPNPESMLGFNSALLGLKPWERIGT